MKETRNIRRWIIWSLAVAFYFYEYFIRVAPSAIVSNLFESFHINAATLATISAAYLYGYAPMQIPVGILTDRYGARKLLTLASIICGIATVWFGLSPNVSFLIVARILMGIGSAFAFIGMIYITSHWFHGKMLARLVGIGNSIGMLGAVCGQGPFAELVKISTWETSMVSFGILGIVLGIVIFISVRNDPENVSVQKSANEISLMESIRLVAKNKQTWINGIVAMLLYAPTVSFGGLWAIPFLKQTHGYSNATASFATSMIYVGWIVAGPIIGHYSDKTCNRKLWLIGSIFTSLLFFGLIIYLPIYSKIWIFSLMFLLGSVLAGQLLNYCLAIELNSPQTKGVALALTNCLVFGGGAIIQTGIGLILDKNWGGKSIHSVPIYSLENYQNALILIPIALILGCLMTFFIKEKKKSWCKNPAP